MVVVVSFLVFNSGANEHVTKQGQEMHTA